MKKNFIVSFVLFSIFLMLVGCSSVDQNIISEQRASEVPENANQLSLFHEGLNLKESENLIIKELDYQNYEIQFQKKKKIFTEPKELQDGVFLVIIFEKEKMFNGTVVHISGYWSNSKINYKSLSELKETTKRSSWSGPDKSFISFAKLVQFADNLKETHVTFSKNT